MIPLVLDPVIVAAVDKACAEYLAIRRLRYNESCQHGSIASHVSVLNAEPILNACRVNLVEAVDDFVLKSV